MYKVGICGHFGVGKELYNGQTIKTKIITNVLKEKLGDNEVKIVDTHMWKKKPLGLIFNCYLLFKECENIIVLPAHNGLKVFSPLFMILKSLFRRKVHYVVIGGWLPNILKNNSNLKRIVKKYDGIYVETKQLIRELEKLGLTNIRSLPNCKELDIVEFHELIYDKNKPFKLCTFSRVMKEKGIEDAIQVVKEINEEFKETICTLDIYGSVESNYIERFNEIKKGFPEFIKYKGVVEFNESVDVLKKYFILLFPTHFVTEGIPGTIIDSYAAGVPVIASRWNSSEDIIDINKTGILYNFNDIIELKEILIKTFKNPNVVLDMKKNCIIKAKSYIPYNVIDDLIKYL